MAKEKEVKTVRTNRIKRTPGDQVVQVLIYVIVGVFALTTVLPFIYVLAGSFATERQLTEQAFFLWPDEINLTSYQYILNDGEVFKGLGNSLLVTIVGTIINMVFSTTLAYPLSRKYFRGRNFIMNMVIITMLFSGGMIPSFLLIANILKLKNSFFALWLPGAISAFNMIIIKNYFQGLPDELEEAARMDGATDLGIFVKVILPLSKPVLASVSLFYAVGHWNSYFGAMMYINEKSMEVVQIVLRRIIFLTNSFNQDVDMDTPPVAKGVRMAVTVVATVPILLIYPFVQKYFTQGVMVGAVKG